MPINGESWFAVETTDNLPWLITNHAQPEPKRVAAAFSNSALKFSTEPKSRSIAAFKSPCKVVPFSIISRISCGLHDRLRCYVMQYVFQLGFYLIG